MFGYVVLHYQNTEVTEKCVNTLLENFEQSPIVIVVIVLPIIVGSYLNKSMKETQDCSSH